MSVRVSHSSINTYLTCGQMYKLQYIDKLRPVFQSSALSFGKAFDEALNVLLEQKKNNKPINFDEVLKKFDQHWEQQEDKYTGIIDLPKNPNIQYSKYDLEYDLLTDEDEEELREYIKSVEGIPFTEPLDVVDWVRDQLKEVEFVDIREDIRSIYNFTNWLSIKNKARLMLDAYIKELLPKIDTVLLVQENLSTKDGDENELTGVADFVCTLVPGQYGDVTVEKGEIIIPDNKTSSVVYDDNSVATSPQLSKYAVILNEKYNYNIKKGAYFVINKRLSSTKTKKCLSCGAISEGSHRKCNETINNKRCNGELDITHNYYATTQLVVQNIPEKFQELVMENVESVINGIENKVFTKNLSTCSNIFGKPCQFFNLCHKGSKVGLINVDKCKKKE